MSVLFFDYWTTGIHNFISLHERLKQLKVKAQLLHLGSWRDSTVSVKEELHGILCEDISLYENNILKALKVLKPQVVVMLNTTLIMDRTMNRLCRMLGIRTIYLMHGIKAIGSDLDEFVLHQNAYWTWTKRLGKVSKYAGLSFRYFSAVAKNNPFEILDPRTYGFFIQMAFWPGSAHERPWPHKDIYCDRALVYANVYRDLMLKETGYPKDRVVVVGNPNLDAAYGLLRDPEAKLRARKRIELLGVKSERQAIVYMEDAFPEQGMGGWTDQTRIDELKTISATVEAAGFDFIIKMHPGSHSEGVIKAFSNSEHTHVVLKTDLAELILGCVATLGHISTTLMLPIILECPLIVPTWSPGLERYGYYVTAGAATPAESPEALADLLKKVNNGLLLKDERLINFVQEFITYTDGHSQDRIVSEIVSCMKDKSLIPQKVAA